MAQTIKLKRSATPGAVPNTSSLALGEVAINTNDGKMYIKKDDGTESIVEIGSSALSDSFKLYEYSVSSSQTTFSGSDDNSNTLAYNTGSPPYVQVFLNGVLLDWSTDYTATNGTSVVLSTAAASGDLIQIAAYTSTVVSSTSLAFDDNNKLLLGTSSDLELFHDGSNSIINDAGTGNLKFQIGGSDIYSVTTDGIVLANGLDVEASEFIGDIRGAVLFKAQAGEALSKGDVVYISGISGNTTVVSKADADDASKMPAFGVVADTASSGNPVDIYTNGILSGINTASFSIGDELYVSTTAGVLTNSAPTGESAKLQKIAKVTRSDSSAGSIFITGAGRTNAVPNLDDGDIFIGNSSNQAVTATLDTSIVPENTNLYYTDARVDSRLSSGNVATIETSGNVTIGGNLTVNGTTTTIDTTNLNVEDKNITLNYSTGDSSASANGAGITIQDAVDSTTDATLLWNTTNDEFDFSHGITTGGNVTIDYAASGYSSGLYFSAPSMTGLNVGNGGVGGTTVALYNNNVKIIEHNQVQQITKFDTKVEIEDTTQSTSTTTGSLVVDGGVGIAKNLNVGNSLEVATIMSDRSFFSTPNSLVIKVLQNVADDAGIDGSDIGIYAGASNLIGSIGNASGGDIRLVTGAGTGTGGSDGSIFFATGGVATSSSQSNGTNVGSFSGSGNFNLFSLGTNTSPGSDDLKLSGYGLMGNRSSPVYITNAGTGGVQINADGVHGTANRVALFDQGGITFDDPLSATGEVYTNSNQSAWAFRATTGSTSNSSGLWFTGTTARLLLRDSSGNIKTMLAANGTNAENVINNNTIWHAGNDGSGSGLDADTLDGQQGSYYLNQTSAFNNQGQVHNTRQSFASGSPSFSFGFNFVQGNTNGPGVNAASQYYSLYTGLGSQYPATGSGSYGMELAIPRNVGSPYIAIRYNENNSLGSWQKISAGYADSAGSVAWSNVTGAPTIPTNNNQLTNGAGYITNGANYNVNNQWLRENGDNANVKLYGNTRQMAFRTDGTSEYATGVGGFAYVWMYGGNSSSQRIASLAANGSFTCKADLWTQTKLYLGNASTNLEQGSGNSLKVNTGSGYIELGPQNTTYAHIYTDRGSFYFNKNTLYANGNTMWTAGNDGSGSGLDADTLDGYHATSFRTVGGSLSASSGTWYTIAYNSGNRASARFHIRDTLSSRHQSVHFYASHMYGNGNAINVVHSNVFSTSPIRYIRIKEGSTYDGALLQVYFDNTSTFQAFMYENDQSSGWVLLGTPVPDGTSTGISVGNFSALTNVGAQVDIDKSVRGGFIGTGSLYMDGNITAYSDRRVKSDLQVIPDALNKVKSLNGYTFDRTDQFKDDGRQTGLVAQEVLEVLPEAVTGDEEGGYALAYGNMVGLLVEAIKELKSENTALEDRIAALENN